MPPIVLTIAGSDPSGASGLQADLPTFAALGTHGTSVVTVITAQDTAGVRAFHPLDLDLIAGQLDPLLEDLPPAATKTGMLRDAAVVELVAERARAGLLGRVVVDPVLVDSTGARIVSEAAVAAYRSVASAATVFTPNRWEAELLTGCAYDEDERGPMVAALRDLGAPLVVVTGGRGTGPQVEDVVISADTVEVLRRPRVEHPAIRGTGCTFSAATAAELAQGRTPSAAAQRAAAFVARQLALEHALRPGRGRPGVPHLFTSPPENGMGHGTPHAVP